MMVYHIQTSPSVLDIAHTPLICVAFIAAIGIALAINELRKLFWKG